ncbi:Feruloyl CoA ortho-hydroxylase 2 [Capsicum baccatum]|uniref:Feruloyl CoA ortho-hydroxylase 2 n=1 Tax=Capsicum baccatum TaxID=33114 RepID=A0A2G2WER4_CAPBA|nr:Feruloyl CoA ortho-hydroxylase 2 [Capsicum baccatum]
MWRNGVMGVVSCSGGKWGEMNEWVLCPVVEENVEKWDLVLEYMKWAKPIIEKFLELLLERLNVKQIDEPMKSAVMGTLIVNLIHYPVCPSPELIAGAGRHADASSITILLQDDVGGLYVREPKVMAGFMCHHSKGRS